MPDLQTLQDQMVAAIMGGDMAHIADEFAHSDRLAIFRNNTLTSLTEALKTTFPVTVQLCDERFFAYAAHEFITRQPPKEARLSEYGASFPRFLASFPPCRDHPVIAAMAAFEWAISSSLNDAEEALASIAAIEHAKPAGGKISLRLQPHLRFVISRWPVLQLWAEHKSAGKPVSSLLKRKTERIAITRRGEDIQFLELDAARFAFWRVLAKGQSLEAAATRALAREPLFDLLRETLLLFRSRLVTRVIIPTYH
jgi:hypothetical protein